jgi:hypothetical protein
MRVFPGPGFASAGRREPAAVLAGGLLSSALAFLAVWSLVTARRRGASSEWTRGRERWPRATSVTAWSSAPCRKGVLLADGGRNDPRVQPQCLPHSGRASGSRDRHALAAAAQGLFHGEGSPVKVEDVPASVVLRTGTPMSDVVLIVQRPDGSRSWVSANIEPLTRAG